MTVQTLAIAAAKPVALRVRKLSAGFALAWLYVLFAVPVILFDAFAMAPFQVADEFDHAARADQLSRGGPIFRPHGGVIDGAIIAYSNLYRGFVFHREIKQTPELAHRGGSITWSEPDRYQSFESAAQYGPLFYLPEAAVIFLGRTAGLSPAWTLASGRIVNGATACGVGFLALSICRRGRAVLFLTLLFPMTLQQFGSLSQDAFTISLSLLAGAVASRVLSEERPASTGEFGLFAAIVFATTLARPSQIALALLAPAFLHRGDAGWRPKAVIGCIVAIAFALWFPFLATLLQHTPEAWGVSIPGQFHWVLVHPLKSLAVLWRTFATQYHPILAGTVAQLGWGWTDELMPNWYYWLATAAFVSAMVACRNTGSPVRPALVAVATLFGTLFALSFTLYLSWTKVGKATIDGFQGRYFLSVVPLLGWLVPAYGPRLARLAKPAWYLVLILPAATILALPGAIMSRYYGSWRGMGQSLAALFFP